MRFVSRFRRRLAVLFRPGQFDRDLEEEMRSHLEMQAEENAEAGMDPDEARYAARRQFGNATLLKATSREVWGWASLERLGQDLKYSLRVLRRSPAFTAVAVLTLALGIGANTAMFSLLNAVLLRTLPVPEPHRLVQFTNTLALWDIGSKNWHGWFSYPQLEAFQKQSKALAGIFGATAVGRVNVGYRGSPGVALADACTANFFSVLGITPQYGRFFTAEDDRPDGGVAVLSDRFWQSRFSGDPSVVGSAVTINQVPFTVIGVAPREFSGTSVGSGPDIWTPLRTMDRLAPRNGRWSEFFSSWLLIAGRLRPGITREQAQAELDVIQRQLLAEQLSAAELSGQDNLRRFARENHLALRPAASGTYSGLRESYAFPLALLMAVAGIVLVVTSANLANLLLARGSNRRREIGVRLALGASRGRVVRQLLTESIVLALIGGALAIPVAWWGAEALVRAISTGDAPLPLDVRPDWRVFGFAAAVSLFTGILFGLAPALRCTRAGSGPLVSQRTRGEAGRSSRTLDRALVVSQVALSVVLVSGAGLFVRTLQNLWRVNVGYDRENVLMFAVDAKLAGYPSSRAGAVYREILRRMQGVPDVRSAAASVVRPIDDQFYLTDRINEVDGRRLPERDVIPVAWNAVSPGYFSTISTPLLLGRDFGPGDDETAPKVVIVDQWLAHRAFPGVNPLGKRIGEATIVGVVKDSHYSGVRDQRRPVLFYPLFQHGGNQEFQWGYVSFELRYLSRSGLLEQVRREVASVDRSLPVFRVKTLRAQSEEALLKERLLATLSSFFGGLALLLACLGLYGVIAYGVECRTGELGVRLAMGARWGQIMRLVLGETLFLALAGVAAGVPLALWAGRYAKSLLFGISAADPMSIAAAIAALVVAAGLAGYVPARRAASIDPSEALRHE